MTKEELMEELKKIPTEGDRENNHESADALLLEYINDEDVEVEYDRIQKWYS